MAGPTGYEPIGPPLAGPAPQPIEDGKIRAERPLENDPFAPLGIKLGSFIIRPAIELGGTFTDNAGETPDKESAVGAVFAPEVSVVSEDERYRFEADARAEIISYDKEEFDENTAEARAKYRYDLSSLTSVDVDAGYQHFLESFPIRADRRRRRRWQVSATLASAALDRSARGSPDSRTARYTTRCSLPGAEPRRSKS
jgi:hypothetical protein